MKEASFHDGQTTAIVGGGGAAGLNSERIAARLGCPKVFIPDVGAGLSAAGALMSNLVTECRATHFARSDRFDFDGVNGVLDALAQQCRAFVDGPGSQSLASEITFIAEARYPHQVWEIDVPLRTSHFDTQADVRALVADFHAVHREVLAIDDPVSEVKMIGWKARASYRRRAEGRESPGPVISWHRPRATWCAPCSLRPTGGWKHPSRASTRCRSVRRWARSLSRIPSPRLLSHPARAWLGWLPAVSPSIQPTDGR